MNSPDNSTAGLLECAPDPQRYENPNRDPDEVALKIASYVPRGSRVLDVGCGTGCNSEIVALDCGAALIGIEPDADRAAEAQKRGLNVIHAYLTEHFFEEHGTFDVILFVDVLEHLANPGAVLKMVRPGLTPNGRIIVSVPNVAHWSVRWQLLRGNFNYEEFGIMDATHLRWFTRYSLTKLFERTGYEVVTTDSTLGLQLVCYTSKRPFRWMTPALRRKIARYMARHIPGMFACQHIFVVTVKR